ncbi:MAG: rbn [Chlamydiia bacterium]|nr:rbn [Chlamydiia bacterium]
MSRLIQVFRVLLYRFKTDLGFLRASALTFTSALAVVPVLAVMFGIAKGFGLEKVLENLIQSEFKDQEEVIKYLIQFGYTLLDQTRGGLIAGIGVITLFYTVLRLLSTVEGSLNAMWGVKNDRTLSRKIIDFLALILICPVFFVISSSLAVYITTHLQSLKESNLLIEQLQPLVVKTLSIIPYVISSALFTFLYIFIPNTRVQFSAALLAGVFAGFGYQLLQAWYIFIQIQVSKTGAIYGSFAALPLFLVWLYFSWIIFLIGAEIVAIVQERLWDPKIIAPFRALSPFEKELACLAITKATVDAFIQGAPPLSADMLAKKLKMTIRIVRELIDELVEAKVLVKTLTGVLPAKNPATLNVYDVLQAVEGENRMESGKESSMMATFDTLIHEAQSLARLSEQNKLIKDIVIS